MNARSPISGNLPVEVALAMYEADTGRLDDAADALEAENARMAKQNAPKWIADAEFWKEELLDSDLGCIASFLADAMKDLDEACKGDEFARDRVCRALHQIERHATPIAEKQLIGIYGRE